MTLRPLAAAAACLALAGCVQVVYVRSLFQHPRPAEELEPLAPGAATLGDCLARLGAPTHVLVDETSPTWVLAWAWRDDSEWGVEVSVPLNDYLNASFDYSSESRRYPALVAFFDERDVLREARVGTLVLPNDAGGIDVIF